MDAVPLSVPFPSFCVDAVPAGAWRCRFGMFQRKLKDDLQEGLPDVVKSGAYVSFFFSQSTDAHA